MSQTFSGKVFKLYDSRYGGSFRLENDPIYYNSKQALPGFLQPGALVSFEAGEIGRSGKGRDIVEGSLKQSTPAAVAASGGAQSFGSRDESIQYQSARKDALAMVKLLIENAAVKLPEAESKRAGVIEALVDRFTASYYEDIGDLGALDRAEPVEIPTPAVAPKKAKVKKVVEVEVDADEDGEDLES
jgi:hypothetical protein